MSHNRKNNMATDYEVTLSDIDKMIRDIKYPPLNGGPTRDDITGMLDCCADIICGLMTEAENSEDNADRAEELESAINDAAERIDEAIEDLDILIENLPDIKGLTEISDKLREVRSDLRRA